MKPKHIVYLITRLCAGGATEAVKTLADSIDRDKYKLSLIYGQVSPGETDVASDIVPSFDQSFLIDSLQREINPLRDLKAFQEIKKHLKRLSPDLVHSHTSKAGILGRLAASHLGVPCAHSTHGHIFTSQASIPGVGHFTRPLFLSLEKWCARKCDTIFSLSHQEIEDLVKLGVAPREHFQCLPSTIEVDTLMESRKNRDALRAQWGLKPEDWLTLLVGRLAQEKGHATMIEVMAQGLDGQLWFVGSGPMEDELKKDVTTRGLSEKIKFLGHRNDLHEWLTIADALVLPSTYEGQGLVLVEAMAAGVSVVASRVGGIPEVVEDGVSGLLVTVNDAAGFCQAISRLQTDSELRKRLIQEGSQVVPRFDPKEVVKVLQGAYQRIIDI